MITENLQTQAELHAAIPYGEELQYGEGEQVVFPEEDGRCFYFVRQGSFEVSYVWQGTRITVAMIGAGELFGEIGFFDNGARVRDIKSMENCRLIRFDTQALKRMQKSDPANHARFLFFLGKTICGKFRRILDEREPLTSYGASLATGKKTYHVCQPMPDSIQDEPAYRPMNDLVEEFKAELFDLGNTLLRKAEPELDGAVSASCTHTLNNFGSKLTELAPTIEASPHHEALWGFIFKEVYPWFMRSRFGERAYYKPKGYAGDFLMMEILYANKPEGDGLLGTMVDQWLLETPAAKAIRSRRRLLAEKLSSFGAETVREKNNFAVMNLACGPNRELFDFLGSCDYTDAVDALCVDVDPEALLYTNQNVNIFPHLASIRLMADNVVKWALGRSRQDFGTRDLIYSSGLTDYLEDKLVIRLLNRCHEHLREGGALMVGNFSQNNPNRAIMDNILQWRLIHRKPEAMQALFDASRFKGCTVDVVTEEQGINLFAIGIKE